MKTLEFNPDGSGILSVFHDDSGHWERIPFTSADELEIVAFKMGLVIDYPKEVLRG